MMMSRIYYAAAAWLAIGAAFPAGSAAQPPQTPPAATLLMDLEPCTALRQTEYEALADTHPVRVRYPTFDDYSRYRSTVEVIEYNGLGSTANPQLLMPRNVTDQDDVYVLLRGNTYRYTYQASWTASDLTQGDLLNVLGTSPNAGMFAVEEAKKATEAATKNAAATVEAKKQPTAGKVQVGTIGTRFGISEEEFKDITERITRLGREVDQGLSVTDESTGLTPRDALVELAVGLANLQSQMSGLVARATANPDVNLDFTDVNKTLDAAEKAARIAAALLIQLQANAEPLLARVAAEVPGLRAQLERMRASLARTRATTGQKDLADLDKIDVSVNASLSALTQIESSAEVIKKELAAMTANFRQAQDALASVRDSVLLFQEQSRHRVVCASVGRFRGKSVKVTIRATPINTRTTPASGVSTAVTATPATPAAATPATPTAPAAPAAPAADGVITTEGSFDAYAPTHVHVKIGIAISRLENPEYKLDKVTTDCPEGKQCFNPMVAAKNRIQVRPATFVSLYVPGHYLWTDDDPSDIFENARKNRFLPYPTFGFSLTDTNENYFLGGGIDIARGVGVLAGVHFGKVRRLRDGYTVGKTFDRPAGDTFEVGEIVDPGFRPGPYISLAIDAAAITKIFNPGGGH